jgi:hydrogenase maturation protease
VTERAPTNYWEQLERPAQDSVTVGDVDIRRRSRVRLRPKRRADAFDLVLEGKAAIVEEVVQSMDGAVQLAVTVEDDPGRDLGEDRQMGHRFFFAPDEVEPLDGVEPGAARLRILVAGIGNVFMGDDGFGVEVVSRLARSKLPAGVIVQDFGIRGMDLAYALAGHDVAILVDAMPRGGAPGSLYLVEPELDDQDAVPDAHGMDPVTVLALARELGDPLPRVLVVGCEPSQVLTLEDDVVAELSAPVRAVIDDAVRMLERLLDDLVEADSEKEQMP